MTDLASISLDARTAVRSQTFISQASTAKAGTLCAGGGFVAGFIMEAASGAPHLQMLALIRATVCCVLAFMYIALRKPRFHGHAVSFGIAGLAVTSSALVACIIVTGADTGYHDAIALVFLTCGSFLPSRVLSSLITMLSLTALYVSCMLLANIPMGGNELGNASALLLIAAGVATGFIYGNNALRVRESQAREGELEAKSALQGALSRLQELAETKNQFFANVSHELRTPLMLILASIETLDTGVPPSLRSQLVVTRRNSLRLLRLVDDLLELARLQTSSRSINRALADVAVICQALTENVGPLAATKGITLTYDGPRSLVGFVDTAAIDRILINLLTNGLKFTPPGGRVTLKLWEDVEHLRISVSDNGHGIEEADKDHLFERFFQGTHGKGLKGAGSGLGLSMCKRLVELHEGTIDVESTAGVGTTLHISLPSRRDKLSDMPSPVEAASSEQGLMPWEQAIRQDKDYRYLQIADVSERRAVSREGEAEHDTSILIVEDHADLVELLGNALAGRHRIYVAGDGHKGIEMARRFRPSLIISDLNMPNMGGYALLEAIRNDKVLHDTPVVLMTAAGEEEHRRRSDKLAADAFLHKPFLLSHLHDIVNRLVVRQSALADQALQSSKLAATVVVSGLAHDLLNPLGFIKTAAVNLEGAVNALADAQSSESQRESAIKKAHRAIKATESGVARVEEVVAQLRQSADGATTMPMLIDINNVVQRTLAVTAVSIHVKTELHAKALAYVRPGQLERVILNLVLNSFEAGGPDCDIVVRSEDRWADQVVVTVEDNGPGIPADVLRRIGEPSNSTKIRGSGLGLAMCNQLVAENGGRMNVTSELGKSTSFEIALPTRKEQNIWAQPPAHSD